MLLATIHDDLLLVVQASEQLAADGEVGIVDVTHDGHHLCRAALFVDDVRQWVGGTAVFQHRREEAVVVLGWQYLDIGRIAVGNHLMHLEAFVPSEVAHRRTAQHLVAVVVHLHHVHACRADIVAVGLLQLHIQRVEALVKSRAYPVEVHQLTVLVFIEGETCGQGQIIVFIIRRHTSDESLQVQAQLLLPLLGRGGAACHQEDVGQLLVGIDIEALEVLVLQIQIVLLLLQFAIIVGVAQVILQRIVLAALLSLGVELEDIQSVVVPVVAFILEAQRVAYFAYLPYFELYGLVL